MPILIEIAIVLSLVNGILSPEHDYVSFGVLLALLIINGKQLKFNSHRLIPSQRSHWFFRREKRWQSDFRSQKNFGT